MSRSVAASDRGGGGFQPDGGFAGGDLLPSSVEGGTVEVDETFIGNDRTIKPKGEKKGRGYAYKHKVLAMVDCSTGHARSMVVDDL